MTNSLLFLFIIDSALLTGTLKVYVSSGNGTKLPSRIPLISAEAILTWFDRVEVMDLYLYIIVCMYVCMCVCMLW